MPLKISEKKTSSKYSMSFNGDFNIYNVSEITGKLRSAVGSDLSIELDLSSVKKIDTAGYQLVLLCRKECDRTGKSFSIKGMSEEARRLFSLYGEILS